MSGGCLAFRLELVGKGWLRIQPGVQHLGDRTHASQEAQTPKATGDQENLLETGIALKGKVGSLISWWKPFLELPLQPINFSFTYKN